MTKLKTFAFMISLAVAFAVSSAQSAAPKKAANKPAAPAQATGNPATSKPTTALPTTEEVNAALKRTLGYDPGVT